MWAARRPRAAAAATVTTGVAATLVLTRFPNAIERFYVHGVGDWLTWALVGATRHLPFSVAEWIEAAAAVGLLAFVAWSVLGVWRQIPGRSARIGRRTGELYVAAMAALWLFFVLWGLSYSRPPAELRLGWATPGSQPVTPDSDELAALTEHLVWRVNDIYSALHGFSDAFEPTDFDDMAVIDAALEEGFASAADALDLDPSLARDRGPAKMLLSSELFSWLGIGGFYFPYTGEANINRHAPRWQQPHTIAHEKAHQRMVASENEANFYGFLATVHSDHPVAQYSGWLFAQRQALRALLVVDPERGQQLLLERYPGVQRDVNHAYATWTRYDGPLEELGSAVNHAYLTANGVPGGIDSYGRSLELIVRYARETGWDHL